MFTFSELNSRTIGQILKAVSAFSIAADINIVVRFQPPSLDGIFHLPWLKQKLADGFEALLGFVGYPLEPRLGVRHNREC